MNRITWKLICCTSFLSICSVTQPVYAIVGGARVSPGAAAAARGVVSGRAAQTQVAATDAAQQSEAAAAAASAAAPDGTTEATASTAPASPCQIPTLMPGWYMGLQVGYGTYRVRNSIVNPASSGITTNLVAASNGFAGGILMGYGKMLTERFYLGAEAFIDANNFDQNYSQNHGIGTATYINQTGNGPTMGFGVLPGIKLTESTLTYLRLGINSVVIKTIETYTGAADGNRSIARAGFVFGVGMETLIMDNYSVRGEFDHMYFSSYTTYNPYNTLVNPSSNQYMLSFIYHFA